jgi:hypothetical protein
VIVGIRTAFRPEAQLSGTAAVTRQRAAIRAAQDLVLAPFPADYQTIATRFATVPYVAMEVDRTALEWLSAMPAVMSIEEDLVARPVLADSAALVGASTAWSAGFSGAAQAVAVLDTGVDGAHAFLSGKVVSEACYSSTTSSTVTLCPNGSAASTAPGSGAPCSVIASDCSHGTHVAGIAAGKGATFSGVGRDAQLIAIQVFSYDSNNGSIVAFFSDIILGLERVYALRTTFDIAAVNLSLSGRAFTPPCDSSFSAVKAAIDNLRAAGIPTIAAAGNDGLADRLGAPACISTAVSVGASTDGGSGATPVDEVLGFSDAASSLSLLAPGRLIQSSVPGGGFSEFQGTSMAAAHVSGAWAVLKQRRRTAPVEDVLASLQRTGVIVTDSRNGLSFKRVRLDLALDDLPAPFLSVDTPGGGSLTLPFTVGGWALDLGAATGAGVDAVHVYAYPNPGSGTPAIFLGAASYGGARPDVAVLFGTQFTNSGFGLQVTSLTPGTYQLVVFMRSTVTGTFPASRTVTVTIVSPQPDPQMMIDAPADGREVQPFRVGGWAVDLGATTGTGVDAIHVYAYPNPGSGTPPVFAGAATYGGMRPDVGAVFGSRFTNSAYDLTVSGLTPGEYRLAVFARSTASGTFNNVRTVNVTIAAPVSDPAMALDTPAHQASLSQPFFLAGWAIDRGAAGGTGVDVVHVWAFPVGGGTPIFVGAASYGGARPDVGAAFGSRFTNSGYGLLAAGLSPGIYDVAVYARSTLTGTFNNWQVVRVTVN